MNRQYIGARYVPKIFDNNGSNEWVNGITYEPLTIVTYLNNSYTSKKPVPSTAGAPNIATEYWANTGNYVGVVSELTEKVSDLEDNVKTIAVTPEMYGAKGDGTTDDTVAIQNALNSGYNVRFSSKTYKINLAYDPYFLYDIGLLVPSNIDIDLNGATIKMGESNNGMYAIFMLDESENVSIRNGIIIGDRLIHHGAIDESGMGIYTRNTENVTFENLIIKDCWGDGLYIGYDIENKIDKHIRVNNVTIDNARRNACSLINVEDIVFTNCAFKNTNGGSLQSGVDCETNYTYQKVKNVTFDNCLFSNEASGLMLNRLGTDCGIISITNCIFDSVYTALYFDNSVSNSTSGNVFLDGINITGKVGTPFFIANKLKTAYKIYGNNITVVANSRYTVSDSNYDGFIVNRDSTSIGDNVIGDITLKNVTLDYSATTPNEWLITQNMLDKTVEIDLDIVKAINAPTKYVSINADSKYNIKCDKDMYVEIASNLNMNLIGNAIYNNIKITGNTGAISIWIGNTYGDNGKHVIFNNSSYTCSVYYTGVGGDAELHLDSGKYVEVEYVKAFNCYYLHEI